MLLPIILGADLRTILNEEEDFNVSLQGWDFHTGQMKEDCVAKPQAEEIPAKNTLVDRKVRKRSQVIQFVPFHRRVPGSLLPLSKPQLTFTAVVENEITFEEALACNMIKEAYRFLFQKMKILK